LRVLAARYRHRAQTCLEIARTLSPGEKRTILTDMAQTWLRLAEEEEATSAVETSQPVVQQQQQIQPIKDEKK
jgi:hypothetical protein